MLNLRPYQEEALAKVAEAQREGTRRMLVNHPTATGKAQPVHEPVLTPNGWVPIGSLTAGDMVVGSNGKPVKVTGVYPQGIRPTVSIKFSDGTSVRCDVEHLWTVQTRYMKYDARRLNRPDPWKTVSAAHIRDSSDIYYVPVVGPVHYNPSLELPLDPYILGVLLGDGGLSIPGQVQLHTWPDIIDSLAIPPGHRVEIFSDQPPIKNCRIVSTAGCSANLVFDAIRSLGLNESVAKDKFVPDLYLHASPPERHRLLQGLLDTNGYTRRGYTEYASVSRSLAEGVAELARSLGGTCRITAKGTAWRHKDACKHGNAYRVGIHMPLNFPPFHVDRKASKTRDPRHSPVKRIKEVSPGGHAESVCIAVDAPDELYVTNGFTVTHNTVTFAHLIKRRGGATVVLVHRDELVRQAVDKIRMVAPELDVGVVKARENDFSTPVVVASVQTLANQQRLEQVAGSGRDLVIVDEAHHAVAWSWSNTLTRLGCFHPDGPLTVGFTATPERTDGVGLGEVWERVVDQRTIIEMTAQGYLAPLRGQLVKINADMSNIRTRGGDLEAGGIGGELERSGSLPQIAQAYLDYADSRKTLAFMPTVRTAHQLAAELFARGVNAEAFDGSSPMHDRRGVLERFGKNEIQVIVNCMVLTEGFDEPSIECVLMGRPTKSRPLLIQMVGRGTRLHPGKQDCLVLDVTDATESNSLVTVSAITGQPSAGEKPKREPRETDPGNPGRDISGGQASHTGRVNLFGSHMRWLEIDGGFCLPAGDHTVVLVPVAGERFEVVVKQQKKPFATMSGPMTIDYAQGLGEDLAAKLSTYKTTYAKTATWLDHPPTTGQLRYVASLTGRPYATVERVVTTKGLASDYITRALARQVIAAHAKKTAAT